MITMRSAPRRGFISVPVAALAILLAWQPHAVAADSSGRPAAAGEIEQGFNNFFLLATSGNGDYVVYQRVEDPLGLSSDAEVVCMLRACFLELAHVSENHLVQYSDGRLPFGEVRRRLGAVRDAYLAMRASPPDRRSAAAGTWHDAIADLARCFGHAEECP